MDFTFSLEQEAFRAEAREFIENQLPPRWQWYRYGFGFYSHYDEIGDFAREITRKLGAKGWIR